MCGWQQDKGRLQECFSRRLPAVSKHLAWGLCGQKKKEVGHKIMYFHKVLSVGLREFHTEYLLLTGRCSQQHLLLFPLMPYLFTLNSELAGSADAI